jgi:uncharacterized protein (TIGR00288 family)
LRPWWQRPTAEGLEEQDDTPQRTSTEPAASPATPFAESAPEPEPLAGASVADEPLPVSQGTEPAAEPAWRRPLGDGGEDEAAPEPERNEAAEPLAGEVHAEGAEEKEEGAPAGEAEEEDARRRKRSRRGRRRKNGRTTDAASAEGGEEEDEDLAGEAEEPDEAEDEAMPAAPVSRRAAGEPAAAPRRSERAERAERARLERRERTERAAERHDRTERHEPAALAPAPRTLRSPEPAFPTPQAFTQAGDLERLAREIIITVPDSPRRASDERKIAMFCDFENIALGVRDSEIGKFDINLILERLIEKGKIIVKKAYADWERYSDYKRPFHEAAIELIDIPQKYYSGKNSADIKMVVDAMDLSYSKEHLDTFVILSGDSDFSPLVSKLKENNKYVIGVGVKNSSSNLLIDNCDEFIYYEDVWRDTQKGPKLDGLNKKTAEVFSLLIESIQALLRDNKEVLWGSMIKQTMQRKKPSFNEGYYGYSTFSELLEDAERKSIIKLKKDQRSGTYIVTGFAKSGGEMAARR